MNLIENFTNVFGVHPSQVKMISSERPLKNLSMTGVSTVVKASSTSIKSYETADRQLNNDWTIVANPANELVQLLLNFEAPSMVIALDYNLRRRVDGSTIDVDDRKYRVFRKTASGHIQMFEFSDFIMRRIAEHKSMSHAEVLDYAASVFLFEILEESQKPMAPTDIDIEITQGLSDGDTHEIYIKVVDKRTGNELAVSNFQAGLGGVDSRGIRYSDGLKVNPFMVSSSFKRSERISIFCQADETHGYVKGTVTGPIGERVDFMIPFSLDMDMSGLAQEQFYSLLNTNL